MKLYKVNSQFTKDLFHNREFLERINRPVKVDFSHDCPYLSGYNRDAKTIYIDRHLKRYMLSRGKRIDVSDFLVVHETVEKALIDLFKLHYQRAHHIATYFESLAVKKQNVNWWLYTKFLQPQIKTIYNEKLINVPRDLDLTPYKDEHDKKILREIMNGARINKKDKIEIHQIDPQKFVPNANEELYNENLTPEMLNTPITDDIPSS